MHFFRPALLVLVLLLGAAPLHAQDDYFDVGELTSSSIPSPYIASGTSIDFDSDGDLDLVYPVRYDLILLENDGAGNFTRRDDLRELDSEQLIDWPRDLAVADFNGDGRDDLFIADHGDEPSDIPFADWPGGQSQIFIQTEDGRLVEETSTRLPTEKSFTHATAVGDVTGNGLPDIYLASYASPGTEPRARFYINDGSGHFTSEPGRIPSKAHQDYPASELADVDQDGDLDLILGGSVVSARDLLLLNDGSGHFTEAPSGAMPLRYAKSQIPDGDWRQSEWASWNIETADFNNDGYPDLAVSMLFDFTSTSYSNSSEWEETRVQLLLNNQDGTFRDATDLIPQHHPRTSTSANEGWIVFSYPVDLNSDGYVDLVSAGQFIETRLFYNVGGEYFVDATHDVAPVFANQYSKVVPGDFTGDAAPDVAVLSSQDGPFLAVNTTPYVFDNGLLPEVTGISPESGGVGTVVTVAGSNLAGAVRAWVGSIETSLQVVSNTGVEVTIPDGAKDAPITVMTPYGSASSAPFNVGQVPVISQLSKQSGTVGAEITISGNYLGRATSVTFSGTEAAFTVVSDQQLSTTVPEGATSGPLRIVTPDGEVSADFTVMTPPPADAVLAFSGAVAVAPDPAQAPQLNLGGAFTMETWVYLNETPTYAHFMGKPHPTSEAPWTSYQLGLRDGRLALEQSSGASDSHRWVQAPGAAPTGRWVHVAGTLSDGTLRVFVDGEEVAQASSVGPSNNDVSPFTLGSALRTSSDWPGTSMSGRMREARVWSRALTEAEVQQAATASLSGTEQGLVAYWPLDEGTGTVAADHGPNGYDLTFGRSDGSSAPVWSKLAQAITAVSDARSQSGATVTIEGVLSSPDFAYNYGNFYLQDETGGIFVFSPDVGGVADTDVNFAAGDRVRITGEVGAYRDQTQVTLASYEILGSGDVPAPVEIGVSEFTADSPYQGQRVQLSGLTLAENSGWPTEAQTDGAGFNVTFVTGGGDSLIVRIDRGESFYDGSARPAGVVDLTGTLGTFRGTPQLWVFFEGDVQQQTGTDRMEQEPISSLTLTSFPNPFRERATLRFELPAAGEVIVEVYDLLGRRIAAPVRGWHEAGSHEVTFEAVSRPSGLYHAVIMAGGHREHASLLLAR